MNKMSAQKGERKIIVNAMNEQLLDISGKQIKDKDEVFQYMANLLYEAGYIRSTDEFVKALYEREEAGSTYIGDGMAIPHGKSETVEKAMVVICRCSPFLYVSAEDSEEVQLVVMLAIPKNTAPDVYMDMLTGLTRILMDEEFVDILKCSEDKKEILAEMGRAVERLEKF